MYLFLLLVFTCMSYASSDCLLNIELNDPKINLDYQPIIYNYERRLRNAPTFVYPPSDSNDCLCVHPNRCRIHLACPGTRVNLYKNSGDTTSCKNLRTTYLTNYDLPRKFNLHGCASSLESGYNVRCEKSLKVVMRSIENRKRAESVTFYAVGYELNLVDFLTTYYVMFDPNDFRVFPIVRGKVISIVEKRQKYDGKDDYEFGLVYERNVVNFTDVYSKAHQVLEFERQVENKSVIDDYFSNDNYLVKGQLISRDDMYYVSQQKTTMFYENTVPMWRSVNEGNWKSVGRIVRKLADDSLSDFNVFVVPVNFFKIDDKEILLDISGSRPVYIPQIIVKVAVDSADITRGVVFHTVNDPYTTVENVSYFRLDGKKAFCESFGSCSDDYPEFSNATRGLTFCCTLQNSNVWEIVKDMFRFNIKFNELF